MVEWINEDDMLRLMREDRDLYFEWYAWLERHAGPVSRTVFRNGIWRGELAVERGMAARIRMSIPGWGEHSPG